MTPKIVKSGLNDMFLTCGRCVVSRRCSSILGSFRITPMEFKWTPDVLNEGQTVNSATFEAENRVYKLSLTKISHTYMSIEYIGISYTDVITKMKFDINGTEKEITYTFNRYDVIFTFPIEPATSYTILASISIHPIPYSSKKETGYTGLRNLGATCYMNALIQCLYHIKKFRAEVFLQEPKRKTFQLQKLLYKLTNDFDVDTRSFMNNCRWVDNVFTQQDIHEFTINVFHALENENKTIDDEEKIDHGKIDDNFFVDRLFKGMMNNYIKGDCGCLSVTKSTFYDLSFEIRDWCNNQVAKNINESLEQLDAEEVLENDNQYHCEKHGKVNARKGIEIAKLPPVLLVLLKRFSMNYETFESSKVNDYYEFFDSINFTLNRKTNAESREEKETIASDSELLTPLVEQGMHPCLTEPESAKYDLFGVIVHSGGTSDGHYYCYIKLDGWYKFNDTVVTRVCEEEALYDNFGGTNPYKNLVKNHSAYMLIYVDSTKWNEIIETKVDLLQSLIDRIKESESGKSMDIRYVTRNDILGYNGIGLFYFEDDVTLRDKIQTMKARSDDTLYVFEKSARKKYVNIYDAITFEKLSSDDSVDDKRIYFVCETSYKVSKKSVLVFVKKYRNNDECLKNNFIDFELKACMYIDKNEKGLEAITSAMNIEDNYCIYVEERLNVEEDLNDTTQETEPEIDPTPIDTSSTKKERKILKKEISQYIEEKEQPTKKRNASKNKTCKYSLKKYDLERTYKENGISNGSIFICVKKTEEQQLIDDYNGVKNRRHIVLKTDNFTTVKYINQDLNYPGLLKFVSDCFMCDNIEIVKFKGTIGSNNMEELKIKHDPKFTAIRICNGTGVQDLNKIKHIHELLVESKVVRGLYRKISVLECFKKDISIEKSKEEFYAKEGIKEEIHAEITYNKKVYDTLKENFTLLEVYKNSPVIYEYESVDEYKGDELLVVKEKTEEKELRMVRSNGTNFIGYPIILPLKDLRTVKEFRLHYGILSRLTRYSSGAEHTLEEDDRVDNFDNLDVMVNYES